MSACDLAHCSYTCCYSNSKQIEHHFPLVATLCGVYRDVDALSAQSQQDGWGQASSLSRMANANLSAAKVASWLASLVARRVVNDISSRLTKGGKFRLVASCFKPVFKQVEE